MDNDSDPGMVEPQEPDEAEEAGEPEEAREPTAATELIEATGEPRVDESLRRLAELADLPVSEHPPVFERVHASLVDVLGEHPQQ